MRKKSGQERIFVICLFSAVLVVTNLRVQSVSANHHLELAAVETELAEVVARPEAVILVTPPKGSVIDPTYACFEFGYMATNLVPILGVISLVLKENKVALPFYGPVLNGQYQSIASDYPEFPVIDMSRAGFIPSKECTLFGSPWR